MSSTQAQISMPTIRREQHAAIFTVINLSRGTLGWGLKTAKDLDEEIKIWAFTFNDYKIPDEHLLDLWKRARDLRIARLQNGLECPDFTAELLAACWVGANGLQAELREKEIRKGRTLTANAETQCKYCFGTGRRYKFDENGKTLGIIGKCNHED